MVYDNYNPITKSIFFCNFFRLLFGRYEKVRTFVVSYN